MEVSDQLHVPAALLPGKETLVPVGQEGVTCLDTVVKRKILSPRRDSNPPIIQPVTQRFTCSNSKTLRYLTIYL
jgi:hypothetical protein